MHVDDFTSLCEFAPGVVGLYLSEPSLGALTENVRRHHRDLPARVQVDRTVGVTLIMLQNPVTGENVHVLPAQAPYTAVDIVVVRDSDAFAYFTVDEVLKVGGALKAGATGPSGTA